MTKKTVYRSFVECEERAAAIYLRLARRFAVANPKLAVLWLDMSHEEKEHAGLLAFCLAEKWFIGDPPNDAETRKFLAQFKNLEKRAADPKISVDQAFELAIELESSEESAIYCRLTTPVHASMYLLKRKIESSAANHVGQLVAAGRKFKVGSETMARLRKLKSPLQVLTRQSPHPAGSSR